MANMDKTKLRVIAISVENYQRLKRFGQAGDSFNDALTNLFKLIDEKQI